jgi:hypothetical protein
MSEQTQNLSFHILMTECLSRLRVKYSLRDGKIAKEGIREGQTKEKGRWRSLEKRSCLGSRGSLDSLINIS